MQGGVAKWLRRGSVRISNGRRQWPGRKPDTYLDWPSVESRREVAADGVLTALDYLAEHRRLNSLSVTFVEPLRLDEDSSALFQQHEIRRMQLASCHLFSLDLTFRRTLSEFRNLRLLFHVASFDCPHGGGVPESFWETAGEEGQAALSLALKV